MDDLKYALGFVCVFSFTCAVGFGSVIGGNVGASFTYFFALLPVSARDGTNPKQIVDRRNPCTSEQKGTRVHQSGILKSSSSWWEMADMAVVCVPTP